MRLRTTSALPLTFLLLFPTQDAAGQSPELQALAREFFAWRAMTQPSSYDDMTRVDRPDGWVPDWSARAIRDRDTRGKQFAQRLEGLNHADWSRSDSVDVLLLRSAIARVDFELNTLQAPSRNPDFYVQQTLGAVFEIILQPPPFDATRARNVIVRLESIPQTLHDARANLTHAVPAFASLAVHNLASITEQLQQFERGLTPLLPGEYHRAFRSAVGRARDALTGYAAWLKATIPDMRGTFAIGAGAYDAFLRKIALMPYTGEGLLVLGRLEWERSVAFDHYEALRNKGLPAAALFPTAAAQMETERRQEADIRRFLVDKEILDIPSWMGHYLNLRMPDYLLPLRWLGVTDDLTSETRLGQDGVSYILDPSPDLSFFRKSTAQDPRPIIVHEGIPGHYFHLTLSWSHPNPIRRRYIDSGPNEGIAFYAEEMMLQHGLFDDQPRTRETIYRFMRLRALRVEVDVKLARGEFSIDDAADYLERVVPVDRATALQEAAFFAATPGQAISYQIGKLQIVRFIADAKILLGKEFRLRDVHNFIWLNSNVPIALQRWEYLGLTDEMASLW